jgi:hypothetical protein
MWVFIFVCFSVLFLGWICVWNAVIRGEMKSMNMFQDGGNQTRRPTPEEVRRRMLGIESEGTDESEGPEGFNRNDLTNENGDCQEKEGDFEKTD